MLPFALRVLCLLAGAAVLHATDDGLVSAHRSAAVLDSAAPTQQPDAPKAFKPGPGIELPKVKKEVRPKYTADARARGIHGTVWIEAVVLPNGKVGEATVTKSLDSVYGLDRQALEAARKWRFTPGLKFGKPVPVLITIEMTFTLK